MVLFGCCRHSVLNLPPLGDVMLRHVTALIMLNKTEKKKTLVKCVESKLKLGYGKWRMRNGEWEMGNGIMKWEIENRKLIF